MHLLVGAVDPSSDEGIASIALPFTFPFYGVPYSMVQASANGMVSFATAASEWVNSTLPAATVPNTVFAFWDDLILRNTGVCTTTVGTAPHRQFVIEWKDAGFYPIADPTTHLTFEIVLDEYAKTVDVVYQTMQGLGDRATGSSATVGVQEGSGASFDLVAYNTPGVVTGGTRFRWAPSNNVTVCASGVYDRVYEAVCDPADLSVGPVWGVLNYTSQVPTGGAIHWEARVSDTQAGLASATPLRLPDAPRGASGVPSSLDVRMFLRATQRGLERMRFLQLTARLDPGAGTDARRRSGPSRCSTRASRRRSHPPAARAPSASPRACAAAGRSRVAPAPRRTAKTTAPSRGHRVRDQPGVQRRRRLRELHRGRGLRHRQRLRRRPDLVRHRRAGLRGRDAPRAGHRVCGELGQLHPLDLALRLARRLLVGGATRCSTTRTTTSCRCRCRSRSASTARPTRRWGSRRTG
ncbi:MAG: hypothetical protein U0325_31635 [Polyangiales bacterium]